MRTLKLLLTVGAMALLASSCNAILRVSVTTSGEQLDGTSTQPALSDDGNIFAFASDASIDPNDDNGALDVMVREVGPGLTYRISSTPTGGALDGTSFTPSVSGNGRFVAWASNATNVLPADADGAYDVFVTDLATGMTTLESVSTAGTKGNAASTAPALSEDGRLLVFQSTATNLVANDTNGTSDVFLRDRTAGTTVRISTTTAGAQATGGNSTDPAISDDGTTVAFISEATDLVPGDTNGVSDVFRWTASGTERISLTDQGNQTPFASVRPAVDQDGDVIAFETLGALVPEDTSDDVTETVYVWTTKSVELVSRREDGTTRQGRFAVGRRQRPPRGLRRQRRPAEPERPVPGRGPRPV